MDYTDAARQIANAIFVQPNATATVDLSALVELAQALDAGSATPQSCAALTADQLSQAAGVVDLVKNPPPSDAGGA